MLKKIFLVIFTILICISFSSCKEEYPEPSTDGHNMSGPPPIGIYSKFIYEVKGDRLVDNEIKVQFGRFICQGLPYAFTYVRDSYIFNHPSIQNIQIAFLADSFDMNPTNLIKLYQIPYSEFASKKYEIEVDEEGYIIGDIPTFTFSLNEFLVDREIRRGVFLIISYDSYIWQITNCQLNIFGNTTSFGYFKVNSVVENYFECNRIYIEDFVGDSRKEE